MHNIEIEIRRNRECHTWDTLAEELKRWLRDWGFSGVKPKIRIVANDDEARSFRFFGSPQIVIDGKDVDPMAEKVTNYHATGCRLYIWKGTAYEYPPKAMVEQAVIHAKD